ncbi:MAG: AAA family ATPase [Fimbriimonadaceae bacterium]|nr:AAA family ATPase [Fimbriimonadaceae bacterium]
MLACAFHEHFFRCWPAVKQRELQRRTVGCIIDLASGKPPAGAGVKKLRAPGDVWEARVDDAHRLLFGRADDGLLLLWDVVQHDRVNRVARFRRLHDGAPQSDPLDLVQPDSQVGDQAWPTAAATSVLGASLSQRRWPRLYRYPGRMHTGDLLQWLDGRPREAELVLTREQEVASALPAPVVLLNAPPGCGKTSVLVHRLARCQLAGGTNLVYVTWLAELRDHAQGLWADLVSEAGRTGLETPSFLTYPELCQELIVRAGLDPLPGSVITAREVRAWFDERYRSSAVSFDLVCAEIRGVIKGLRRAGDLDSPLLSETDYLELPDWRVMARRADRQRIHSIARRYQERLRKEGQYDEMDAARHALQALDRLRAGGHPPVGGLFCDEVQDLTEVQLELLLALWQGPPAELVLAGDEHQMIYPSAFRWDSLYEQIRSIAPQVAIERPALEISFRNSPTILRAADRVVRSAKQQLLAELRVRSAAGPLQDHLDGLAAGTDDALRVVCRPAAALLQELAAEPGRPDWVVLATADEAQPLREALAASSTRPNWLVSTTERWKGREALGVVLWRPCGSNGRLTDVLGHWSRPDSVGAHSAPGAFEVLNELNRLYVQLTRAQRHVVVLEDGPGGALLAALCQAAPFEPGQPWLPPALAPHLATDAWLAWARHLEADGLYAEAGEANSNAGDDNGFWRCEGAQQRDLGNLAEAISLFERASAWPEAAACCEAAHRWADAARLWEAAGERQHAVRCSAAAALEFEARGDWENAATGWEAANEPERATRCRQVAAAQAAETAEARGDWEEAARLWDAAGEPARAARCHQAAAAQAAEARGDWEEAARLWDAAGEPAQEARCRQASAAQAAETAEARGDWEKAARRWVEARQPARAARCRQASAAQAAEARGDWKEAARLWDAAGEPAKANRSRVILAALAAENLGHWEDAAKLWHQAGEPAKANRSRAIPAALAAENLGHWEDAAKLWHQAGRPAKAIRCRTAAAALAAENLGHWEGAAKWWAQSGETPKAEQCWALAAAATEQLGHWADAARQWEQAGERPKAMHCWALAAAATELRGDWEDAARHWEQAGALVKAFRCRANAAALVAEHLGDWEDAARQWEQAGDRSRAARCWASLAVAAEQLGDWADAARRWERAGEPAKTTRCRAAAGAQAAEDSGDWAAAGRRWTDAREPEKARTAYRKAGLPRQPRPVATGKRRPDCGG